MKPVKYAMLHFAIEKSMLFNLQNRAEARLFELHSKHNFVQLHYYFVRTRSIAWNTQCNFFNRQNFKFSFSLLLNRNKYLTNYYLDLFQDAYLNKFNAFFERTISCIKSK